MKRKPNIRDFKKAASIGKQFEVDVHFAYTGEGSEADVEERYVVIDLDECPSIDYFWSLVFHEIGHVWCYDNGKYVKYHDIDYMNSNSKRFAKYIRRNGLKAERFVDNIGRRLAKESGIKFTYKAAYKSKRDVEWYRNWVERNFPL